METNGAKDTPRDVEYIILCFRRVLFKKKKQKKIPYSGRIGRVTMENEFLVVGRSTENV